MPSVSRSQQQAMAIAEHSPEKLYKRNKGLAKMSKTQLHDYASGSMSGKPEHVAHHSPPAAYATPLVKGSSHDAMHANQTTMRNRGMSEFDAVTHSVKASQKASGGHPNRHLNLGSFLHKRKTDR